MPRYIKVAEKAIRTRAENRRRFSGPKGCLKLGSSRYRYGGKSGGEISASAMPRHVMLMPSLVAGMNSMAAHAKAMLSRPFMQSKRQLRAAKEK